MSPRTFFLFAAAACLIVLAAMLAGSESGDDPTPQPVETMLTEPSSPPGTTELPPQPAERRPLSAKRRVHCVALFADRHDLRTVIVRPAKYCRSLEEGVGDGPRQESCRYSIEGVGGIVGRDGRVRFRLAWVRSTEPINPGCTNVYFVFPDSQYVGP